MGWYDEYEKPSWAPRPELFGKVWRVVYLIAVASFGFLLIQWARGSIPSFVGVFISSNILMLLAYSYFKLMINNNMLGAIFIWLVVATLFLSLLGIWSYYWWIGLINLPYLGWSIYSAGIQTVLAMSESDYS